MYITNRTIFKKKKITKKQNNKRKTEKNQVQQQPKQDLPDLIHSDFPSELLRSDFD